MTTWNVLIRKILNLNNRTHRFLIEPLSERKHIQNTLVTRFVKFSQQLQSHSEFGLRFLHSINSADQRTVTGRTLKNILTKYKRSIDDTDQINLIKLKKFWRYWDQNHEEVERTQIAKELFSVLDEKLQIPDFNRSEVAFMFEQICIN